MINNNKLVSIAVFVFSVFLSGCANNLNQVQSGFLGDYSKLKKSKKYDNTKVFQAKDFNQNTLTTIQEIKLVPFEVWIKVSENNNTVMLNTQRLQELNIYFHQKLKNALKADYRLVDVVNPNTLTIKGAFSNIKLSEPELSVTDFIPIRIVLNAGDAAYLNMTNQKNVITEVSIEVEFLLGKSSQRVFAMTATKQIGLTMGQSGDDGFKTVTQVLDIWIGSFVKKLAQIRQTTTKTDQL